MHVRLATAGAVGADPTWGAVLDLADPARAYMAKVKILTGAAAGRELLIASVDDDVINPFSEITPEVFNGVLPGDEVEIDNRDFVAWSHYHWYTVQRPDGSELFDRNLAPWAVDGHPLYPQRLVRPVSANAPTNYKGTISNKMIYVQPTHDAQVWPTSIFPYVDELQKNLGDVFDDHFRLWYVENSPHGAPEFLGPALTDEKDPGVWSSRLVSYDPVSAQALRDVVRWLEEDVPPPFYTGCGLSPDNALVMPTNAAERGGIQPVVTATVDGGRRADVKVGALVSFLATAEQPPGMGSIVSAHWDFEGRRRWETVEQIDGGSGEPSVQATHVYDTPGTYFASFRAGAHRDGAKGRGEPVLNLYRVRVVVTA
jgi:hypothetical protein